jgi:hypothetical protein
MDIKLNIKPMSINNAFKGRKFRTKEYDIFIVQCLRLLPNKIEIPDETNITLNYQKQPGATSDGIIIPDDAPASLRAEAGNIVKQLKAQNLI